jgi:phage terminase large subunit-like protein
LYRRVANGNQLIKKVTPQSGKDARSAAEAKLGPAGSRAASELVSSGNGYFIRVKGELPPNIVDRISRLHSLALLQAESPQL